MFQHSRCSLSEGRWNEIKYKVNRRHHRFCDDDRICSISTKSQQQKAELSETQSGAFYILTWFSAMELLLLSNVELEDDWMAFGTREIVHQGFEKINSFNDGNFHHSIRFRWNWNFAIFTTTAAKLQRLETKSIIRQWLHLNLNYDDTKDCKCSRLFQLSSHRLADSSSIYQNTK